MTAIVTPALVTKADVEAFIEHCVFARAIYQHQLFLFEGADLRRELFAKAATQFFSDLNIVFIEHTILSVCRLTDPAEQAGHKNLTTQFFLEHADFSAVPGDQQKFEEAGAKINAFRHIVVAARNKVIGHLDRNTALSKANLGAAPTNEWREFWLNLQDFVNLLHRRYVDPVGHFYLNTVCLPGDTEEAVKAIRGGVFFEEIILGPDSDLTKKCHEAAFRSKFATA